MDHIDHRHPRGDVDVHARSPFDRHLHVHPTNNPPSPQACSPPLCQPRPRRYRRSSNRSRRTGKTSFLRLLLDTSNIASTVSREQLASVAKFVQGSSGHTSHVRTVSINVDLAPDDVDEEHPLNLTLIDTPSLDFDDKHASERALQDILRHVEARLAESLDDERKALNGDHHVHLCLYFLDPNYIVPPSVPAPPAPPVPRARTNSLSTHESEPVILDPPVTSNPVLCRPILPPSDITAIRRLSARVNVLPVVACADVLTTDRLTAVKMAIRRDLAEAGIGFGIFDLDIPLYAQLESKALKQQQHKAENGYMKHHLNGPPNSPPSTPITPTLLRLPFSLISPDMYSHSDGIARAPLSRSELMQQYMPSNGMAPKTQSSKVVSGKFVRHYRWGSLDVMDASHCEFLHLRGAIFHHMETLQKYTREYLFEKFKSEVQPPPPVAVRSPQPAAVTRLPPMRGSRPILAIETAPSHANANANGHPALSVPRSAVTINGEPTSAAPVLSATTVRDLSPKTATSARTQRQRAKKITVACNFCRSRKLKCDGGRPACGQCYKRQNPCDYTASNKRRTAGAGKQRKQYGDSESEGDSLEDASGELDGPLPHSHLNHHHLSQSHSPEVPSAPSVSASASSAPHSRRSSNVSMLLTDPLPPLSAAVEPRQEAASAVLPPITSQTGLGVPASAGSRRSSMNTELPPIATLSAPSGPQEAMASFKGSDTSASTRRRAPSTAPGRSGGGRGGGGSKIVACNFCRGAYLYAAIGVVMTVRLTPLLCLLSTARKTRCDGAHPTCSSCSRRSLRCNYVNDPTTKARSKSSASTTPPDLSASASSRSSPASSGGPVTLSVPSLSDSGVRSISELDADIAQQQPAKKMRLAAELSTPAIAVLSGP
ncbi:hypothetical protein BN946_scf184909.g3 [Trametes cinnabarina]|uniref:Zn(2)-C6 fungal-type domain-containing protein n=1 Tax=Pycnoporus cinnabarinus TaxID=5643 RepID=A0A060SGQ5_PYCCI|nr:hypothetical protein BN946_scf184909.g3 [Trametes cinnabarina]